MKVLIVICMVLSTLVASAQCNPRHSCCQNPNTEKSEHPYSQLVKTVIIHSHPGCEKCAARIKEALMKYEGIRSVNVDIPKKLVIVSYYSSRISPSDIKKALRLSGYPADDMAADEAALKKLPPACRKHSSL